MSWRYGFDYLVSKISLPLPVLYGDDKQKFNSAKIALNRALTASNPSAKKRSENEERNKRRKKASASSPLPHVFQSLLQSMCRLAVDSYFNFNVTAIHGAPNY